MAALFNPHQGPHLSPEELRLLTAIYLESVGRQGGIPMPDAHALAARLATGITPPEAYLEYMRLNQRLQQAEDAGRTAVDLVPLGVVGGAGDARLVAAPPATTAAVAVAPTASGSVATASIAPTALTAPAAPTAAVTTPITPATTAAPSTIAADGIVRPIVNATAIAPPRGTRRRRRTPDSDSEDSDADSRPAQRRRVSIFSRLAHRVSSLGRSDTRRSQGGGAEDAQTLGSAIGNRDSRAAATIVTGVVASANRVAGIANDPQDTDNADVEADEREVAPSARRTAQAMSEARETLRNIPRTRAGMARNNEADDKDDDAVDALLAPLSSGTRARRSAASGLSNENAARYPQRIGSELEATPVRATRRGSLLNPGGRMADQTRTPFTSRRSAGFGVTTTSSAVPGNGEAGNTANEDPIVPANDQARTPFVNRGGGGYGAASTSGVGPGVGPGVGSRNDGPGDTGNVVPVTPANIYFVSEDESEDEKGDESAGDSDGKAEGEQEEEELRIETEAVPALPPQFIIRARRGT